MSIKSDFIETPLLKILQEGVSAVNCLNSCGIEVFPVLLYVKQSILLNMMGFSEQKLRAIHWFIVSQDLTERYKVLKGDKSTTKYGEYSDYSSKYDFYKYLLKIIKEQTNKGNQIINESSKENIKHQLQDVESILKNSVFSISFSKDFYRMVDFIKKIKPNCFMNDSSNLLNDDLKDIYCSIYRERNTLAHNTLSYQQDYFSIRRVHELNNEYGNYFSYFVVLILLDEIFTALYRELKSIYDNNF